MVKDWGRPDHKHSPSCCRVEFCLQSCNSKPWPCTGGTGVILQTTAEMVARHLRSPDKRRYRKYFAISPSGKKLSIAPSAHNYFVGFTTFFFIFLPFVYFFTGIIPGTWLFSDFIIQGSFIVIFAALIYAYVQKFLCHPETERKFHWRGDDPEIFLLAGLPAGLFAYTCRFGNSIPAYGKKSAHRFWYRPMYDH